MDGWKFKRQPKKENIFDKVSRCFQPFSAFLKSVCFVIKVFLGRWEKRKTVLDVFGLTKSINILPASLYGFPEKYVNLPYGCSTQEFTLKSWRCKTWQIFVRTAWMFVNILHVIFTNKQGNDLYRITCIVVLMFSRKKAFFIRVFFKEMRVKTLGLAGCKPKDQMSNNEM